MTPPKLPSRLKWNYGSGDIAFSLTNTILSVYFAIFLTDVVGVSAKLAAAIFIGRTWDYINDPLVGRSFLPRKVSKIFPLAGALVRRIR